jgi:hypothetical protein
MMATMPRYPHIHVALHSANPLAAISAIRGALRHAGVDRREIAAFSQQAFACRDAEGLREVCRNWVEVDVPSWQSGEDAPTWPPSGSFPSARA